MYKLHCVSYCKREVGKSRIATNKNSQLCNKAKYNDVSYFISFLSYFILPCLLPSCSFYHEVGIIRPIFVSRTVYLTWIWPIKEKMTDIFCVGNRSFINSSKAAFYSGNVIHVEVDFFRPSNFSDTAAWGKTQIYL